MLFSIRRDFRHYFNPLHVYCRLRDFGLGTARAKRLCRVYERFLYRFLP